MTEIYNSQFALALPVQDLPKLSFCGSKVARVQEWANQLPATRIAHISTQLYRSLPEINRLKTDPKTRLEMLEVLRPSVQNTIAGLAKQFLGQPLILPPDAQKTAVIAQALQKTMADGYSLCVKDLLQQKVMAQKTLKNQDLDNLAKAVYRAMFSIGALHLRSCQIYTQMPKGLWLHLHQLFQIAEHFQLAATPVPDSQLRLRKTATARESYIRTLMLACSRSNQLSQQDLAFAYEAFEAWASYVTLCEDVHPNNANPFVINLSHDEPPGYKERLDSREQDDLLELDFSELLLVLGRQHRGSPESARDLATPKGMPAELIQHLDSTWRESPDRQQHRHKVKTVVDVCVGLTECHYHLAGATNFAAFTEQAGDNFDNWHDPLTLGGLTPGDRKKPESVTHFPARVSVQNISAGGYCLYWQDDMPPHTMAGQLLGIRDIGKKEWHLGVVRWVRQLRGASQMGVQILALDARPVAASLIYDIGGYSDAMRALLVPAVTSGATPTLITIAPFQEHSRVRLMADGRATLLKLEQCIFATHKVRQFQYQTLNDEDPK